MQELEAAGLSLNADGSLSRPRGSSGPPASTSAPSEAARGSSSSRVARSLGRRKPQALNGRVPRAAAPAAIPAEDTAAGWAVEGLEQEGAGEASWVSADGWGVSAFDEALEAASKSRKGRGRGQAGAQAAEGIDEDTLEYLERRAEGSALLRRSTQRADLARAAVTVLDTLAPRELERLEAEQREADKENRATKKANVKRREKEQRLHRRLRIIGGSAAGKFLLSSQGENTRPMMEKVRGAVFNMITSAAGGQFPEETRWLDLFAGTGAIGIEALSRGCREGHFVELEPWVCKTVLGPNLRSCEVDRQAVVHQADVLEFLRASRCADR